MCGTGKSSESMLSVPTTDNAMHRKKFPALRAGCCNFFPGLTLPCGKPNMRYSYRPGDSCPNADGTIQQRYFPPRFARIFFTFSFPGFLSPCGELNIDFLSHTSGPGCNFPAPMECSFKILASRRMFSLICFLAFRRLGPSQTMLFIPALRSDFLPLDALCIAVLFLSF